MSNMVYTTVAVEGKKTDLVKLKKIMEKILNAGMDSGGDTNISDVLNKLPSDIDIDIRSWINYISPKIEEKDDISFFYFSLEEAWNMKLDLYSLIEKEYNVKFSFVSEETGCNCYFKRDYNHYFEENYWFDYFENEICKVNKEQDRILKKIIQIIENDASNSELINFQKTIDFLNLEGFDIESIEEMLDLIDSFEDASVTISIHEYECI